MSSEFAMRCFALLLLFCVGLLQGGAIQGVVIEHAAGRPLSRSSVFLTPVPATAKDAASAAAKPMAVRSGASGEFSFERVPSGVYVLTASREGYFTGAWGQRLPTGRGAPFRIDEETRLFAEIRMRHKGAITGRVLDENGVGTPHVVVLAYGARLPLRSAGQGTSDDRGVYRIPGLEPGKYWVRSAPYSLPEGGAWLPAFAPQGHEVRDARLFAVTADADTGFADVSPIPGSLYQVSGPVTCNRPGEIIVALSSDTGQQIRRTYCSPTGPGEFQFGGLATGSYELSATSVDLSGAAFVEFTAGGDIRIDLPLGPMSTVATTWHFLGGERSPATGSILIRRQNLSSSGDVSEIQGTAKTVLAPGYWEVRAQAPQGHFIRSVDTGRGGRRRIGATSDWFEVYVPPNSATAVRITVGTNPMTIEGKVLADGKPVGGVPVFVWPMLESARRALGGAPQTLSAADGTYRFDRLPPGSYKPLATFDLSELDQDIVEVSQAPAVSPGTGSTLTVDLPLWTAPW